MVSYNITSKRGSREQFANMVSTCKEAGVGIIIDAITNHMTGEGSGSGIGGSSYSKYNYPLYGPSNFHYCDGGKAADITDYSNRTNAQFCEESGLADLAQEQTYVRDSIAAYLKDLQSLGVAGFRVDSSVQQPASNLTDILSQLDEDYWATFEVETGAPDAVKQDEYWNIGATMAFGATGQLLSNFETGIANLVTPNPLSETWGEPVFPPSKNANLFVTNHDKERYGGSINRTSPNNAYVLAHIFILGWNWGVPEVFSAYNFTDEAAGQPQNEQGLTNAVVCGQDGWTCEHRYPAIANMVGFHNAVSDGELANVQVGTPQQVAFGRGDTGFLAINNDGETWSNTFQTSLPQGSYCDVIHYNYGSCNGTEVEVGGDGQATFNVSAFNAVAFYKK